MAGKGKPAQQVAALPYIWVGAEPHILLITSRERARWIVPKGWPMKGKSPAEAAAQEALEEAGVRGQVHSAPVGYFSYRKILSENKSANDVLCRVAVYPLHVTDHLIEWKERGERKLHWCALQDARGLADDDGLADLLHALHLAAGAPLR